jgi:hypothetical protein
MELASVVTNPDLGTGWLDSQGRNVATKCLSDAGKTKGTDGNTYDVQYLWSNSAGKCVVAVPRSSKKSTILAAVLTPCSVAIIVLLLWWRRR